MVYQVFSNAPWLIQQRFYDLRRGGRNLSRKTSSSAPVRHKAFHAQQDRPHWWYLQIDPFNGSVRRGVIKAWYDSFCKHKKAPSQPSPKGKELVNWLIFSINSLLFNIFFSLLIRNFSAFCIVPSYYWLFHSLPLLPNKLPELLIGQRNKNFGINNYSVITIYI